MTQEEKDLLLKDLCARLPYGVKVFYEYVDNLNKKTYGYSLTLNTWCIDEMKAEKAVVKPYLFPLSSMTEEQKKEYQYITERWMYDSSYSISDSIDWLNKNHFDFRNLIGRNLAIDCTNLNIY